MAELQHDAPVRCASCGGQVEDDWAMCGWCGTRIGSTDGVASPTAPSVGHVDRATEGVASPALVADTVLDGRYRIDTVLGRGGFGITYRARDLRLSRDIAVKELFPLAAHRNGHRVAVAPTDRAAFTDALIRFRREAAALARFSHPGIVRVFEVLEENDTAYLVMELIEGSSMSELLMARGGPLMIEEVLDVVVRVGSALTLVHDAGMLHRDVNPSNIMLDGTRRIVLIDFGLARAYGDDISGSLTRAVTPGYAPPEQYAGSVTSGPPCDVFGLAATAYKLLTGQTPTNVFDRQSGVMLPAPTVLRPEVPPMVSAGVLDGMELDPGHRPSTAEAFIDRLGLHGMSVPGKVLVTGAHLMENRQGEGLPDTVHEPGPAVAELRAMPVPQGDVDATVGAVSAVTVGPSAAATNRAGHAPNPAPSVPPQVMPIRSAPFAPWHDGSAPVVGPGERWRGWITWPVTVAIVALVSASPVLLGAVLALLVLPAVATAGDIDVHRNRQRTGAQRRRWHDLGVGTILPIRLARNLLMGALRAVPAIAIAAIGIVVERALVDSGVRQGVRDAAIRISGVAAALALVVPARLTGRTFRSDLGTTKWATWAMESRRRPGWRAATIWVICLAATAFAVWLSPEFWPLT